HSGDVGPHLRKGLQGGAAVLRVANVVVKQQAERMGTVTEHDLTDLLADQLHRGHGASDLGQPATVGVVVVSLLQGQFFRLHGLDGAVYQLDIDDSQFHVTLVLIPAAGNPDRL